MNASHDWLLLSLLSAISLATADAFTKWRLADHDAWELAWVRFAIPGALLFPILIVHPLPDVPPAFWGWVLSAIPLEFLAMMLYMRAIRQSPLYLTLPYLAFTPAFSALTGYFLLGEKISRSGLSGILLVTAGAYLLNLRHIGQGIFEPFRAVLKEQGSLLMLIVAILYGFTSVLGKGALAYCPPLTFGAFYFALLGILVFPIPFIRRDFRIMTMRPVWALIVGIMTAVMAVSHFLALEGVEVAYMVAVKRTSLLFGMIYGAILFREKGFGLHFLAGLLMVAGVALISAML